jgi:hypothetical protein
MFTDGKRIRIGKLSMYARHDTHCIQSSNIGRNQHATHDTSGTRDPYPLLDDFRVVQRRLGELVAPGNLDHRSIPGTGPPGAQCRERRLWRRQGERGGAARLYGRTGPSAAARATMGHSECGGRHMKTHTPLRVGHCDCCDRPQRWLSRRCWCRRCEREFLAVRAALVNRGIIQHERR